MYFQGNINVTIHTRHTNLPSTPMNIHEVNKDATSITMHQFITHNKSYRLHKAVLLHTIHSYYSYLLYLLLTMVPNFIITYYSQNISLVLIFCVENKVVQMDLVMV